MTILCCIKNCRHSQNDCKLRRFPRSRLLSNKWVDIIKFNNRSYVLRASHRICLCHFSRGQYEVSLPYDVTCTLVEGALPDILMNFEEKRHRKNCSIECKPPIQNIPQSIVPPNEVRSILCAPVAALPPQNFAIILQPSVFQVQPVPNIPIPNIPIPNIPNIEELKDVAIKEEEIEVFSEPEQDYNLRNEETDMPAFSLQDLCRICANSAEHLMPVFGSPDLSSKINLCLPITVTASDSLPLNVCRPCVSQLEHCYDLATTSQKADTTLRNLLHQQQLFVQKCSSLVETVITEPDDTPMDCESSVPQDFKPIVDNATFGTLPCESSEPCNKLQTVAVMSCKYCSQNFDSKKARNDHIVNNHTFKCPICNLIIKSIDKKELEFHKKMIHPPKQSETQITNNKSETEFKYLSVFTPKIICSECSKIFRSDKLLKEHICVRCFICTKCSCKFNNSSIYNSHQCINKISCNTCNKNFESQLEYNEHLCQNGISCIACDKLCNNECQLKIHKCIDKINNPKLLKIVPIEPIERSEIKCKICLLVFESIELLNEHKCIKLKCSKCTKAFTNQISLDIHACVPKLAYLKNVKSKGKYKSSYYKRKIAPKTNSTRQNSGKLSKENDQNDPVFESNDSTESSSEYSTLIKCNSCLGMFKTEDEIKNHACISETELENRNICPICNMQFKNKFILKSHMNSTHSLIQCTNMNCYEYFNNAREMNSHHRKQHLNAYQTKLCESCGKSFNSHYQYKMHIYYVHQNNENRYKCDMCGKAYRMRQKLVNHISKHINEKNLQCNICDKKYYTKYDLKLHIYERHSDKNILCNKCGKKFTYQSELRVHNRMTHDDTFTYKCSICHCNYNSVELVTEHYNTHDKKDKIHLSSHIYYKESPFQCKICLCFSKNELSLKTHIKILHKMNKKEYNSLNRNEIPEFIGTKGNRKFCRTKFERKKREIDIQKCPICSKLCKNKCGLAHHVATHSKELKFKCNICEKSFPTYLQMTSHEKYHDKGKVYECNMCDMSYTNKKELAYHLKYLHLLQN